jgi:hypothetical protein
MKYPYFPSSSSHPFSPSIQLDSLVLLVDLPDTLDIVRVPHSTSSAGTAPACYRFPSLSSPFSAPVLPLEPSAGQPSPLVSTARMRILSTSLGGRNGWVEDEEVSATRREEAGEGRTSRRARYPSPADPSVSSEALQASLSCSSERKVGKR